MTEIPTGFRGEKNNIPQKTHVREKERSDDETTETENHWYERWMAKQ